MTIRLSSRQPLIPIPHRTVRQKSSKIIFISCEGVVTEEEYFRILSEKIFDGIANKIQFISVRDEFLSTPKNMRTREQVDEQNKSTPRQVMNRITSFKQKQENDNLYKFDENLDDEFWLVIDVDDHTDTAHIDEFNLVISECERLNYRLAVTNPFFEFWLYLHHCEVVDKDKSNANTVNNPYFKNKMRDNAGVKLSGTNHKKPLEKDYNIDKIKTAIQRAKELHTDKYEKWPNILGSHVYFLVDKFIELSKDS